MIKFFRHIRKSLLTDNKFSKYLLYAVGEIILVVIGILIALQINNWNELKKTKAKENHALLEIVSDLETNITNLNGITSDNKNNIRITLKSLNLIINQLQSNEKFHDSLAKHFSILNNYFVIDLKTSGYESLTSIGIDLISSDKMRSEIGEYYTSRIPTVESVYNELRDDYYHYMLDYLRKDFIQFGSIPEFNTTATPRNYQLLKDKGEYLESLKVYLDVYLYYNIEVKHTLEASSNLKINIENYLNID